MILRTHFLIICALKSDNITTPDQNHKYAPVYCVCKKTQNVEKKLEKVITHNNTTIIVPQNTVYYTSLYVLYTKKRVVVIFLRLHKYKLYINIKYTQYTY
jgi:hypothetical protein